MSARCSELSQINVLSAFFISSIFYSKLDVFYPIAYRTLSHILQLWLAKVFLGSLLFLVLLHLLGDQGGRGRLEELEQELGAAGAGCRRCREGRAGREGSVTGSRRNRGRWGKRES